MDAIQPPASFIEHFPKYAEALQMVLANVADDLRKGLGPELTTAFCQLPDIQTDAVALNQDAVTARCHHSLDANIQQQLDTALRQLWPWRKGPFHLFDIDIDTEWRSNWKWDRLALALPNLAGQHILDVGCGNGYYLFRMADQRPRVALGIDPFLRYYFQFLAVQKYVQADCVSMLPIGLQDLPALEGAFDTVFCLGVLYHQRSPLDFLVRLRDLVRPGGTLILETLTIAGDDDMVLSPAERYAKMHNCYFLPTNRCLEHWLVRSRFVDIELIDCSITTVDEQRQTAWMTFESLVDFLDPLDASRTIEGYPAPCRSTMICRKKST